MNAGLEMVQAKHVSGKNIFWPSNKEKIGEERIFEIIHCPFDLTSTGRPAHLAGCIDAVQLSPQKDKVRFQKLQLP